MNADHIDPVVPLDLGFGDTTEWLGYNWNEILPRMFCEEEGLQILCEGCHNEKSLLERKIRAKLKAQREETPSDT